MMYAVIIVKKEYCEKGDFVFRPLVRAYEEVDAKNLLTNGNAVLLGIIDKDGNFIEYFTNEVIPCEISNNLYGEISQDDLDYFLSGLSMELKQDLAQRIKSIIFSDKQELPTEIDEIEKSFTIDAFDRAIEFEAYNNIGAVNPYDANNPNLYKSFMQKMQIVNNNKSYQKKK